MTHDTDIEMTDSRRSFVGGKRDNCDINITVFNRENMKSVLGML